MTALPVFLAFTLALLGACTPPGPSADAPPPSATPSGVPEPAAGPEPAVVLQRTVCFGTCPAYTVSAYADGRIVYQGDQFVETTGTAEGHVDPSVVAGLVVSAVALGYTALPARLDSQESCPQFATDNPSANTTVRTSDWTRSVDHYHGCRGFKNEKALTAFEDEIDRALGTAAWVGTP